MTLCPKHKINHGKEGCVDCNDNRTAYRGMQTPLIRVASVQRPRHLTNTPAWVDPRDLPTKSVTRNQVR
jgi:hypothetical protein